MARWEPDARERLERAALELFAERGYDQTTVTDIAARAGLTQRTFFRYYGDKREVLFDGGALLQEVIVTNVRNAPGGASPLDAALDGMRAGAALLDGRRDLARLRAPIINAHPELQERELIKMAGIAAQVADALRERGTKDVAAALTAQLAVAVFRISFARWVAPRNRLAMVTLINRTSGELPALTA